MNLQKYGLKSKIFNIKKNLLKGKVSLLMVPALHVTDHDDDDTDKGEDDSEGDVAVLGFGWSLVHRTVLVIVTGVRHFLQVIVKRL